VTATTVLLVAYAALLVGAGLLVGRRVKASGDFFVASRSLPWPMVLVTMLAANIGAGSTVGATGLGYRHGLSAWWWSGSAAIGCVGVRSWTRVPIWQAAPIRIGATSSITQS